jgi:hypothetical protein
MGRIRTIKPEFHAHEELSALPAETHLFAAALVNYADDEGYFNANPVLVKAGTNPLRSDKTPVAQQLDQLEAIGYLEIRKSGLKHYGRICNFDEHQRVSHKAPSKIKDRFDTLPQSSGEPLEDYRSASALKGIEGNREWNREQGMEASTAVAVPAARGKLVCTLPLNTGPDHEVFEADVQEWIPIYPAADIRQELRTMKGWLMGNPKLRKTKSGINRFINSWMSRAQNDAKPTGGGNGNRNHGKTAGNLDALAEAERFARERYSEAADDFGGASAGPGDTGYASDFLEGSGKLLLEGH